MFFHLPSRIYTSKLLGCVHYAASVVVWSCCTTIPNCATPVRFPGIVSSIPPRDLTALSATTRTPKSVVGAPVHDISVAMGCTLIKHSSPGTRLYLSQILQPDTRFNDIYCPNRNPAGENFLMRCIWMFATDKTGGAWLRSPDWVFICAFFATLLIERCWNLQLTLAPINKAEIASLHSWFPCLFQLEPCIMLCFLCFLCNFREGGACLSSPLWGGLLGPWAQPVRVL